MEEMPRRERSPSLAGCMRRVICRKYHANCGTIPRSDKQYALYATGIWLVSKIMIATMSSQ